VNVVAEAKRLVAHPFVLPSTVPQALGKLTYDLYRQIRFRKDRAISGKSPSPFAIELFSPGFLYKHGIDISVVENGKVFPAAIDEEAFDVPVSLNRDGLGGARKICRISAPVPH
jgi:glucans biosynthesis protein